MALVRGGRVRDAGMDGLVQQSPAAGAHRQHPAGRRRGALLRYAGRANHGRVTQTKRPPANPARFTPPTGIIQLDVGSNSRVAAQNVPQIAQEAWTVGVPRTRVTLSVRREPIRPLNCKNAGVLVGLGT
jgi:hypothetical protein